MAADCLFRCIAEYARRARIPSGDRAIQILTDDRVVRGIHDSSKRTRRPFRLLSFRDVVKKVYDTYNLAVFVSNRINMHRNRNLASIWPRDDDFLVVYRGTRV